MPPQLTWFACCWAVTGFIASYLFTGPGQLRLVPVMTNGQAAFAVYRREADGTFHAHALQVPTATATGIARIVVFQDPSLFGSLGLPQVSAP